MPNAARDKKADRRGEGGAEGERRKGSRERHRETDKIYSIHKADRMGMETERRGRG
jgi:hypothetical protein